MHHPLLYEVNTRCWLRELSEECGRPVRLDNVPGSEIRAWQELGFTHIWLMGVWPTGPLARAKAMADQQRRQYSEALPDWKTEDVLGSPYAIADYRVAAGLGGEAGLAHFRKNLHEHGLKLILDFVPNHLGLDHLWVRERPGLFVQSAGSV
ncbi:MAG TPA: alpha-amylase family glycosyl hydrolase, partial [Verrucomicrobiae bacterium]